jgi:hypothetical protein
MDVAETRRFALTIETSCIRLGLALLAKGDLDAACDEWRLVVGLSPGYPDHSAKVEAEKRLAENCSASKYGKKKR